MHDLFVQEKVKYGIFYLLEVHFSPQEQIDFDFFGFTTVLYIQDLKKNLGDNRKFNNSPHITIFKHYN